MGKTKQRSLVESVPHEKSFASMLKLEFLHLDISKQQRLSSTDICANLHNDICVLPIFEVV